MCTCTYTYTCIRIKTVTKTYAQMHTHRCMHDYMYRCRRTLMDMHMHANSKLVYNRIPQHAIPHAAKLPDVRMHCMASCHMWVGNHVPIAV